MTRGAVLGVALAAEVVLIVVTAIGLAACMAVNEVVTGRDLTCEATPDDLCLRVADLAAGEFPNIEWTVLDVRPADCEEVSQEARAATRCWHVTGEADDTDNSGFEGFVYERPDGALVVPQ